MRRRKVMFGLRALAVLLVAHQVAGMASHGSGGGDWLALGTNHERSGLVLGSLVTVALMIALALGIRRWYFLRQTLRPPSRRASQELSINWGVFVRGVAHAVPRLTLCALGLFLVQENLEQLLADAQHAPNVHVLFAEDHLATLPIFVLVATAVAVITSLLRLGLAALARLIEKSPRGRPEPKPALPSGRVSPTYRWPRLAPDLGRAPPTTAVSLA